jgi:hypothetical protein
MLQKSNLKCKKKQEARGLTITQILEFKSGQMEINDIKLKDPLKKKKRLSSHLSYLKLYSTNNDNNYENKDTKPSKRRIQISKGT